MSSALRIHSKRTSLQIQLPIFIQPFILAATKPQHPNLCADCTKQDGAILTASIRPPSAGYAVTNKSAIIATTCECEQRGFAHPDGAEQCTSRERRFEALKRHKLDQPVRKEKFSRKDDQK